MLLNYNTTAGNKSPKQVQKKNSSNNNYKSQNSGQS